MLPLLFPFIADTVIAPPPDFEDIFVNEWGVVVFTSEGTTVAGAPDDQGNVYFGRQPFGVLAVDAPVIWIHGAFFTEATLTVKAKQGWLTSLYPDALTEEGEDTPVVATWEIAAPPPRPLESRPEPPAADGIPFEWAMEMWRQVPSRDLYLPYSDEYLGNFLYYEAGIPFWEPPEGIYDPFVLAGYYSTDGLLISTGLEPVVERINLVPLPDGSPGETERQLLDEDQVEQTICGWAAGNLKSQEISALWGTWRPFFTTEMPCDELAYDRRGQGEKWILFPLPWNEVEEISTLHLEILEGPIGNITYNRLFLGLVRVY